MYGNLGTALINIGLSNARIAIIAPNRYEWCTSYLAVTTSGNIVVPLDKALPENEIESSIIRSESEAVIFDKKYINIFKTISLNPNSKLKYFICMDNIENEENILSLSNLMETGKELQNSGNDCYNNVVIDNIGMTVMLFTSGTTSLAKIVMLSQANICANIYSTGCIAKVTSSDTFLSFLPLHHTYESTTTFLYGLYSGITIAFCDGLRYVAQNLKEYKITGFVCVPLILEAMYKKIKKGIKEKHLQIPFAIMTAFSNFLLKFGIDIRRKIFKSVINQLGRSLTPCYLWCRTNG
jgi:long-chain acyl-CoA synthetase